MRLAKDYGSPRLETPCQRARALDSCSFTSLASILKTKLDQQPLPGTRVLTLPLVPDHANLRGPAYYQDPIGPALEVHQ